MLRLITFYNMQIHCRQGCIIYAKYLDALQIRILSAIATGKTTQIVAGIIALFCYDIPFSFALTLCIMSIDVWLKVL